MKSLDNRYHLLLRVIPILFAGVLAFDLLLYFYFNDNPELTVKVIAISLALSGLLSPILFLVFHYNTKKLREFGEILKESIEKREFCTNPTRIAELDSVIDEINKLLEAFYKNNRMLKSGQESYDKIIRDLKQKAVQFEHIVNSQPHGVVIFKDGIAEFINSYLLRVLGLPSINEFHKNGYRLLDYFERTGEHTFFDGYQDDSWCFALLKGKESQRVRIAGIEYQLDALKLGSDDGIITVSFFKKG